MIAAVEKTAPASLRSLRRSGRRWLLVLLLLCAPRTFAEAPGDPAGETRQGSTFEGTVNAPDFPPGAEWLNTSHPLSISALRGKVVLLDFWTFCCINCMHVIPDLKKLEAKYPRELVVIGVHSAKFNTEKDTDNIRKAVLRYEIGHPVINDKDFVVWRSYGVRAWPTLYLIDPLGKIVSSTSGEGIYDRFDRLIGAMVRRFDAREQIDRRPLHFDVEQQLRPAGVLAFPGKIAADEKSQRLFVTDSNHNRVLVASLSGEVLDVIGDGARGLKDGDPASAQFFRPQGSCFDAAQNVLYVADTENHAIRKIDLKNRTVETLAGNGHQASHFNTGGIGKDIELNSPWDLVLNADTLYIAMAGSHQIWTLNLTTREARVFAGTGQEGILDGPPHGCALAQPSGITTDGARLYFADSEGSAVRQTDLGGAGQVKTLIGRGLFEFGDVDGQYPAARLQHPIGVAWHGGYVYVADTYNNKIKRVNPRTREVETFIGAGQVGMKDGPARAATLNEPTGLCFANDRMFIADANNHRIRIYDFKSGELSTLTLRGLETLPSGRGPGLAEKQVP